jgi:hypothetical protein
MSEDRAGGGCSGFLLISFGLFGVPFAIFKGPPEGLLEWTATIAFVGIGLAVLNMLGAMRGLAGAGHRICTFCRSTSRRAPSYATGEDRRSRTDQAG